MITCPTCKREFSNYPEFTTHIGNPTCANEIMASPEPQPIRASSGPEPAWCEPCGGYHPYPQTVEHWRELGCKADRRDFPPQGETPAQPSPRSRLTTLAADILKQRSFDEAEPPSDDDLHRWEIEPHPNRDYDCLVTNNDCEALKQILEIAEMHLWDSNQPGEERTMTVRMQNVPEGQPSAAPASTDSSRNVLSEGAQATCAHCGNTFITKRSDAALCATCFIAGHRGFVCGSYCVVTKGSAALAEQFARDYAVNPESSPHGIHHRSTDSQAPPELLPCPFCGSLPVATSMTATPDSVKVRCNFCWARSGDHKDIEAATNAWNTRADLAQSAAVERYTNAILGLIIPEEKENSIPWNMACVRAAQVIRQMCPCRPHQRQCGMNL